MCSRLLSRDFILPPKIQTIHQRILKQVDTSEDIDIFRAPQNTNDPSEDTET